MSIEYVPAKSILAPCKKSEFWFEYDYNMNIYRGCCHGCIYCDSRSECYHIENFDKVRAKENAIEILQRELASKRKKGIVGMGAMSDPYNPFEKELLLTRKALDLFSKNEFGTAIFTKSDLITRDIDLLVEINRRSSVLCCLTITCAEDDLSKVIEPNAPISSKRFAAVKKTGRCGNLCGCFANTSVCRLLQMTKKYNRYYTTSKRKRCKLCICRLWRYFACKPAAIFL